MPTANNREVRIHYEVEGRGPPLVLQHGFTRSLQDWRDFGYVADLSRDHQLILIDARGHGLSDKPHSFDDYWPELLVGDLVAVLDDLGVARTDYWGYSLGAVVGWQAIRYAPTRLRALVLGGAGANMDTPASKKVLSHLRGIVEAGLEETMELVGTIKGGMFGPMFLQTEALTYDLANDREALLACLLAAEQWPGLDDVLAAATMPSLVYAGEADPRYADAVDSARRMPNATFLALPGLSHYQTIMRSNLVLPPVRAFLAALDRAAAA